MWVIRRHDKQSLQLTEQQIRSYQTTRLRKRQRYMNTGSHRLRDLQTSGWKRDRLKFPRVWINIHRKSEDSWNGYQVDNPVDAVELERLRCSIHSYKSSNSTGIHENIGKESRSLARRNDSIYARCNASIHTIYIQMGMKNVSETTGTDELTPTDHPSSCEAVIWHTRIELASISGICKPSPRGTWIGNEQGRTMPFKQK